MKKIVSILLVLTMVFALASVGFAETKANPVAGKKVAYIMLLPSATIFQMWKDSCADLTAALGVQFDYFFCDGDFNTWQDRIRTCAAAGYDGILVSHGNRDGSYVFLKEVQEQYPNMEIVCFDTQFYADGESKKLEGVTQLFQQDKSLVTVLLDEMIAKFGEGVRLIKVWRGPNYNSPFDRREVGWQEYEAAGKIKTVGEAYTDGWKPENAQKNMEQFLTASDNKIDAVVASNDGTAGGAIAALTAQGLAGSVPVSGQDADHAALNRVALGTQTVSVWKDSRELGKRAAEIAAQLAGGKTMDQIDGVTTFSGGPKGVEMRSVFLAPLPITKDNLNVVIDAGWISKDAACQGVAAGSVEACK